MTRELLILRHAKSAWDSDAPADFERPLAPRGLRAAPRVGAFLAGQGLKPDFVVSSPAERARQTVLTVCEHLGFDAERIAWDQRIYLGTTAALLDALATAPPDARRVLIAGHNPGLENLLMYLCDSRVAIPADRKLLVTAAVAHLDIGANWDALDKGCGELRSLTRPRSL